MCRQYSTLIYSLVTQSLSNRSDIEIVSCNFASVQKYYYHSQLTWDELTAWRWTPTPRKPSAPQVSPRDGGPKASGSTRPGLGNSVTCLPWSSEATWTGSRSCRVAARRPRCALGSSTIQVQQQSWLSFSNCIIYICFHCILLYFVSLKKCPCL